MRAGWSEDERQSRAPCRGSRGPAVALDSSHEARLGAARRVAPCVGHHPRDDRHRGRARVSRHPDAGDARLGPDGVPQVPPLQVGPLVRAVPVLEPVRVRRASVVGRHRERDDDRLPMAPVLSLRAPRDRAEGRDRGHRSHLGDRDVAPRRPLHAERRPAGLLLRRLRGQRALGLAGGRRAHLAPLLRVDALDAVLLRSRRCLRRAIRRLGADHQVARRRPVRRVHRDDGLHGPPSTLFRRPSSRWDSGRSCWRRPTGRCARSSLRSSAASSGSGSRRRSSFRSSTSSAGFPGSSIRRRRSTCTASS